MKRFSLVLILLLSLPIPSFAMWRKAPLVNLVCDSDLIVVGTLVSVKEFSKDGTDYGQGIITVDETIWGAVNPGETLTLKWDNPSALICPRVEHRHHADIKGIWLLTVSSDREVRADYPWRFIELDRKEKVTKILSQMNICVRVAKYEILSGEKAKVSLILKNPTQGEMRFPGLEYKDGRLYISPNALLTLHHGFGKKSKKIDHLSNRVFVSNQLPPIVVGPNQEHRITLDLRRIFDLNAEGSYTLRFKVKGFERGSDCEFYFNPTEHAVGNDSNEPKNAEAKTTPHYKTQWLSGRR